MLCSVWSPATDSELSMMTLFPSRTSPPWVHRCTRDRCTRRPRSRRPGTQSRLEGHLLQFLPGLGSLGEAGLFKEVLPIVEQPRVGVPRDTPDFAVVGV